MTDLVAAVVDGRVLVRRRDDRLELPSAVGRRPARDPARGRASSGLLDASTWKMSVSIALRNDVMT